MASFTRRTALAGALGFAGHLLAGGIARAESGPKEFRVGYQKGGFLSISKDRAVFEQRLKPLGVESVKWSEFQFGPPMLEAIGTGAVDFGEVGDTPPIFAQAAGGKIAYVAATPASQHALLVPEASPIRTLADIKGKKIAVARGSSAHNVTIKFVEKAGLAFTDIVPAYLAPADASAAFVRGAVDAWVIWDPYYALAQRRQKVRVVATTDDVSPSNSFYIGNSVFAAKYPKTLVAVVDELAKFFEWANHNRDRLAETIAAAIGIDIEAERIAVERAKFALYTVTPEVIAQQQGIADAFVKLGLIPKPIVVRDAVWSPPAG
jgi:sulfonate transport system substrate-binding protein